ncbi:antitermination regulator [Rhodococcus hoagii]|nr:antitermination regulator [Prescottella equi]NKR62568.1 antitermination regulator [Prescottella equi]NKR76762.1 antitermination regulator [Prescottella equi]NKT01944.1 antitermination regulator [Prescottella equi]NKZ63978.1 antitermination regulator [Prescottella equi]
MCRSAACPSSRAAVELVPGAEHADITLAVRGGRLESRAGTSELPSRIDDLQQEVDDGPRLQTIWEHETVRVDDMAHEDRWGSARCSPSSSTPPSRTWARSIC